MIPVLRRGLEEKEYRRALNVYHFLKDEGHGLITGMPGSGKSTYTLMSLMFWNWGPVVYAVPLRQLRDALYHRINTDYRFNKIRGRLMIVYAHDETCEDLARRIRENPNEDYFKLLAEHMRDAEEGRVECKWKSKIRNVLEKLRRRENVVILTTHQIAFMLLMLTWVAKQRNILFVFDEAEELFVKLGESVDLAELEVIKSINKKLYRRLKNLFRPPHPSLRRGWLQGKVVLSALANSVFISASFPPILVDKFKLTEDEYPIYRFKTKRASDTIILHKNPLFMKQYKTWKPDAHLAVLELVKEARANGWAVGIVSKNETQSEDLTKLLEGAGFTVWSDHRENSIHYSDADTVIIRPLGKGYRGVSFFTRKNKDRSIKDYRVIIAFFQRMGIDRNDIHPIFYQILSDDVFGGSDEIGDFIEQMVHAKNFQSLFRFNRFRDHSHLMVLMEWDYHKALNMYAWRYFNRYVNRLEFDDLRDVAKVGVSVIRNL